MAFSWGMNYFAWLLLTIMAVGQTAGSTTALAVPSSQLLAVQRQVLQGKTYVAIGDSISVGSYAPTADRTFPAQVAAQLGMNLVLVAKSGARAAWALPLLGTVQASGAALITVELGTNDVGFNTPLDDFARQYETIMRTVASPSTRVLCIGSWLPSQTIDALIQQTCERYGGSFVSLLGFYDVGAFHAEDDAPTFRGRADWFHPGDAGHAAIAAAVLTTLKGRPEPETPAPAAPGIFNRAARAE